MNETPLTDAIQQDQNVAKLSCLDKGLILLYHARQLETALRLACEVMSECERCYPLAWYEPLEKLVEIFMAKAKEVGK